MSASVPRRGRVLFDEDSSALRERLRSQLTRAAETLQTARKHADARAALSIEERLGRLGFGPEAADVADLIPLIHVAWADGSVSRAERETVVEVLETRGLDPEKPGFTVIAALLETRPSDAWLAESLDVLRDMMAGRPASCSSLVELCVAVADASGGFFGLGSRIDTSERATLERIATALGPAATTSLWARLR